MLPINPFLLGTMASFFGKLAFKEIKLPEEMGENVLNKIEGVENLVRNIEGVDLEKPVTYINPTIKFVKKYIREVSEKPHKVKEEMKPNPDLYGLFQTDRDGFSLKRQGRIKAEHEHLLENLDKDILWKRENFLVYHEVASSYDIIYPLMNVLHEKEDFDVLAIVESRLLIKNTSGKEKIEDYYVLNHFFLKDPDGGETYLWSKLLNGEGTDKFFVAFRSLLPEIKTVNQYEKYLVGVIWEHFKNIEFYDLSEFGSVLTYNSDMKNFDIKEFKETSIQKELFDFLEGHKTDHCFSVIVNGRPGFGKSLTCEYFANKFDRVISLKLHEPAPMADYVIELLKPEIVIIDDLDRICDHTNASFFLSFFESIKEIESVKYVLLTSNNYSKIPVAVRRPGRISQYFDFKLPESKEERTEIVKQLISVMNCDYEIKELEIEYLTDVFNAYGASGLKEYITRINSFGPKYKPSPSDKTFELAGKSEDELFEYYNKEAEQAKKEVSYYMQETLEEYKNYMTENPKITEGEY